MQRSDFTELSSELKNEFIDKDGAPVGVSAFVTQSDDILREILAHLGLIDLANLRSTSKKFKELADQFLTAPNNVIKVAGELHALTVMAFLEFYQQSQQYKDLRKKFETTPQNLNSSEILCIALTTSNIYELDPKDLNKAIDALANVVDKRLVENLRLMSEIIKYKNVPADTINFDDFPELEDLQERFDERIGEDNVYMNLQGANIYPDVKFLGGVNIEGANLRYRKEFMRYGLVVDPQNFITWKALESPEMMVKQLNRLEKMVNNPSIERKRRLMVLMNCNDYVLKHRKTANTVETLDNLIKVIDVILNHPYTKENTVDFTFKNLSPSLFTAPPCGDTRSSHTKLLDLKQYLETELLQKQKSENKNSKARR